MKIHHEVQKIQNILVQEVHDKLRYFIKIMWNNNMGSIHVLTKKHILFEKVLNLSKNYTDYYGREYKIKQLIIINKINRNPHIKINF